MVESRPACDVGSMRPLPRRHGIAIVLALLVGCALNQQQEQVLGDDAAAQVAAELPLMTDPTVVRYITALGQQLAAVTDTRGLAWHFTVVDSREINAFAVPGGWVYVNRGLIEQATDMSQLAGVLAHEIGHVTRRHSVEQLQKAQGADLGVRLLCTLTRSCASGTGQAAIAVGGTALFARFSRNDEREADVEAVQTVVKAGIAPSGIPAMFRLLLSARQRNPNALDAFFATHPLEEERIRDTESLITAYPAAQLRGLTRDAPAFQAMRRRLLALPPPKK